MEMIEIDYGEVEVGKTAIKALEITNETCDDKTYEVQRDPTTNPLDHVFCVRAYSWVLAPGEKYKCEIRYRPFVPSFKNVDYFNIADSTGDSQQIITRGFGIGPEVHCSTKKAVMFCTSENREAKKRIKLTNTSKVNATFMFDVNQKFQPFSVDVTHGLIKPCSHAYVTITFSPLEIGEYTYYLPCIILYQEPIIIELYGHCAPIYSKRNGYEYSFPWKVKLGFEGYMNDNINTMEDLPPISLSKNYLDFGQADVGSKNMNRRISQSICVTNHSKLNLSIKWNSDVDSIFNIKPCVALINDSQSAIFEISFNPDMERSLFFKEIAVSVFNAAKCSKDECFVEFPYASSIRVIGHSFPAITYGWIPQYEIPEAVIMPPCVPCFPVRTTFLIKRFGHLPLMFHFVPPSQSHFNVKPMIGLIQE